MDVAEIEAFLVQKVREIQEECSRSTEGIAGSSIPIGDIDGFDSPSGVELSCAVAVDLGVELPLGSNFFLDDDDRPLSIHEIAENLSKLERRR